MWHGLYHLMTLTWHVMFTGCHEFDVLVSEDSPYPLLDVGVFPADFLYLTFFKPLSLFFQITVWACKSIEMFQHIVKFYNRPTLFRYFYLRSEFTIIVIAGVHQRFGSRPSK